MTPGREHHVKNSKTILYAEDDVVTLTAYKNRLEKSGYLVRTAQDGIEALRSLNQTPPDLILLDLLLPKLTGEDVLKYLNSNPTLGRIPVIVLSTNSILTAANEPLVERTQKHFLKHECTFPRLLSAIEEVFSLQDSAGMDPAITSINSQPDQPAESILKEIEELKNQTPVVCAWTDRIRIEDKWMNLTEFLSKRLHLQVSHGVSPEGMKMFFNNK